MCFVELKTEIKDGYVTLAWSYADTYFIVLFRGQLYGASKIAETVVRIEQLLC